MPSELDDTLNRIMDGLTGPGQLFETKEVENKGVTMPAFVNAPPSLAHYFAHYCNLHKDTPFLVDGETRLTFGQAYNAAQSVAAALVADHGIAKGDRVAIAARNSANWIVAYMGVIMAGGCATLVNGFWTGEEMADGIRLAECKLVLADAQRAARLEGADHGSTILTFSHSGPASEGLSSVWKDEPGSVTLPEMSSDDLATILYTSGSTGQSKGAYSNHRSVIHGIFSYVAQTVMSLGYLTQKGEAPSSQPSALVAVPLFHVTGEIPLFLQSYAIGRKLVLMPKWDAKEAMRLMEAEGVTYFVGVPLMSHEIATHPDRKNYDLSECKSFAAGGAPRPVDHVNAIKEAFPEGFPLLGYGLTETNAVGCGNFNENYLAKPGSTGSPSRPLVDLAILDDSGSSLPQGQVGEISIRSIANFEGYWQNEEATRAAFTDDRYFRTGDLGYLDEDGYVFIVDRKKDIIIRGGENIACIEVEEAIYGHPDIAECSVFGLPDERYGEVPAAVYHVKDGRDLAPDDLCEYLEARIAAFKIPQHMWQSESALPRLGTQKIDKRAVKAAYQGRVSAT